MTTTQNPPVPLAELEARLGTSDDGTWWTVSLSAVRCPALPTNVRATIDGRDAVFTERGGLVTRYDDYGDHHEECEAPSFRWDVSLLPRTRTDLLILDPATTWTIAIDGLGTPQLAIVDPAPAYHPGDALAFAIGTSSVAEAKGVTVRNAATRVVLFEVEASALVRDGATYRFAVPAVAEIAAPTDVELAVRTGVQPQIVSCTGPLTCSAAQRTVTLSSHVTLAPGP